MLQSILLTTKHPHMLWVESQQAPLICSHSSEYIPADALLAHAALPASMCIIRCQYFARYCAYWIAYGCLASSHTNGVQVPMLL
jgi:hypothetical protein